MFSISIYFYHSIVPPLFEETSTISRNSESESPALDGKKCRKEKGATKQDEESEVSEGEKAARKFSKNPKWAARGLVNDYYDHI